MNLWHFNKTCVTRMPEWKKNGMRARLSFILFLHMCVLGYENCGKFSSSFSAYAYSTVHVRKTLSYGKGREVRLWPRNCNFLLLSWFQRWVHMMMMRTEVACTLDLRLKTLFSNLKLLLNAKYESILHFTLTQWTFIQLKVWGHKM